MTEVTPTTTPADAWAPSPAPKKGLRTRTKVIVGVVGGLVVLGAIGAESGSSNTRTAVVATSPTTPTVAPTVAFLADLRAIQADAAGLVTAANRSDLAGVQGACGVMATDAARSAKDVTTLDLPYSLAAQAHYADAFLDYERAGQLCAGATGVDDPALTEAMQAIQSGTSAISAATAAL